MNARSFPPLPWIAAAAAGAAALLPACAPVRGLPGPDQSASIQLPGHYPHAAGDRPGKTLETAWWRRFGSAELNALTAEALAGSQDVAASLARVGQARAQVRIASAALLPELSATAGLDHAGRFQGGSTHSGTVWPAGLTAGYEADLWGRLRAARRGERHRLEASIFDHSATVLIITRDVASLWLATAALHERVTLAEEDLATARKILAFIESRARAGAASPLELAQQRGLTASQEDALAALRAQAAQSELALGLLLGRAGSAPVRTASLDQVRLPFWPAGLPSDLLTRRPDIARAEAALTAADADVTAARAALLPRLTFQAGLNVSNPSTAALFSQPVYALSSGLTAPIFQGGRLRAEAGLSQARREELLANYRQAIITAFGDVEKALLALRETEARRAPQETQLAEARRALSLSETRHRAGAETLLTLLTAQQSLTSAQASHTAWRLSQFQAVLALAHALGGGWGR